MKTPFGFDCHYFFGDYYRGRSREECRILPLHQQKNWSSGLCRNCQVPEIIRANSCPNMSLSGRITYRFLGLGRKMTISAFCSLSNIDVREPHIGCGKCHPLPPEFNQGKQ